MGCIYGIQNDINLKWYIGQTIQDDEKTRRRQHFNGYGSRLLKNAIAKHGIKNFSFHILQDGIIPELLDSYEIETIAKYNSTAPNGYNIESGGCSNRGYQPSEETKQKLSEAKKGKNNPNYGKSIPAKQRQQISESLNGRRHSSYHSIYTLFISLSADMPLTDKRKKLYKAFPNVHPGTIRRWIQKEWN